MLVLASLLIMTTIAVEFAYNTHISYELASAERDRVKAFYLAQSAFNLAKLELKYERQLRTQYASLLKNLKGAGVSSDPLCKQLPLSTGLLKGLSTGALLGEGEGKEGEEETEGEAKKGGEGEGEAVAGAEEFLTFDGDFEVTCDTEERRINLNVFRAVPVPETAPTTPEGALSLYDTQKFLLISLLSQPEFEPIFKGKPDDIRKQVNFIADWADKDDRINEAPGIQGSPEESEYSGPKYHYKVKNGKYQTLGELLLVAGVGDDLYQRLSPEITIYGDDKMNLCQASDPMVKAFVGKYAQSTPGLTPIPPEDSKWETVLSAVRTACEDPSPKPAAVAAAVATSLGISDSAGLAKQITTSNRFYRIEAMGTMNESQVKVVAVLDTASTNPNLWKTLYFRVE